MSYRHYIDTEQNCVFIQHVGEIGINEFDEQMADLFALPNFAQNMNLLRDISQTKLPLGYDLAWIKNTVAPRIKAQDDALGYNRMVAWVVGNPQDFKIMHQFSTIGRLNLRVVDRQPFRDVPTAMKWLGIPEDYEIVYPKD